MVTVEHVLQFLNTVAPPQLMESWDRAGMNCGHKNAPVTKILVALDASPESCREAKEYGAELLVTHHTLLWNGGFITDSDPEGVNVLYLIENSIAHINAHTCLDIARGGVNDVLAEVLGLEDVQILNPTKTDPEGRPCGLVRFGQVPEQPVEAFLAMVKTALGCEGLRYVNRSRPVHRVAVCGGAGASELADVIAAGCDTFVTADVKYNAFRDAYDAGVTLIDAGHFHTENPVCAVLAQKIQAQFPEIQVKISENHTDPMKFF